MRGEFLSGARAVAPDNPELSVAPLIDVSFLLLIFFLVSMTIERAEQDLKVAMQRPGSLETVSIPKVIEVCAGGEIVLHPGPRELLISADPNDRALEPLRGQLEQLKRLGVIAEQQIVIRADDGATQQRVVDVLNCLQAVGVERVSFQDG